MKMHLTSTTEPSLAKLRQALAPTLPVDDPPTLEHALELLKRSYCPPASAFDSTNSCEGERNCKCLGCIFKHLSELPPEIFSRTIMLLEQSMVQSIVSMLSVMPSLLLELQKYPAREFSVSSRDDIFETSIRYGGKSYIAGISNQQTTSSRKVKPKDTTCNYAVFWSDRIGITKVEFVHSGVVASEPSAECCEGEEKGCTRVNCKNCLQIFQSRREWVCAVAITGERLFVKSKGVFLERIAGSVHLTRQIFWDCSKSPLLLQQEHLEKTLPTNPSGDIMFRHVSVVNIKAISVIFSSGRIVAIMSHNQNEQNLLRHDKTCEEDIWMYCPLSDDEKILAMWIVHSKNTNLNLGTNSLVLKTKRRLVWLSHFISPQIQSQLRIVPIANDTVCALYCTDPRSPYSIVGAAPCLSPEDIQRLAPPHFPIYRTSCPEYNIFSYSMHYSEASLEDLIQVQLCMDGLYCIGMLLHYETHSTTVGQFRYDKAVSGIHDPCSIGLLQEQHETNPQIRIKLFDENSTERSKRYCLLLTRGSIVWWFGWEISVVTLMSPDGTYAAGFLAP